MRNKRGTPTKNLSREQRVGQLEALCKAFAQKNKLVTKDKDTTEVAKTTKGKRTTKARKTNSRIPKRKRVTVPTPACVTPEKASPPAKPPRHSSRQIMQVRHTHLVAHNKTSSTGQK